MVTLNIDGKTDKCSLQEDINFQFTGFGIVGKVRMSKIFLLEVKVKNFIS